ncbi:putative Mitochondrial exoribonuclease Cyt-4 [Taphrina deformans PYCC 5710]|uniref:Mitochondrial exoribonuclease Cyt-4 n=1 Tax=Taphrina deformans (strain PYCC 5710 / ATCC 11124 / CBS 356.35 / IMI 108563 / JCM 9778 / NBRC 8474) TaxID=1097556 RepID=R4XC18_TAPDE|nr:putative Mitochondrial exoribonuclease Cyt-4 [Taphrina deformans PYCC 5710]|eukprot:CCG80885.1 putative Mitochondrial exoribonuclease Cyt-4 [Taphrina deformans PYCC 5710]
MAYPRSSMQKLCKRHAATATHRKIRPDGAPLRAEQPSIRELLEEKRKKRESGEQDKSRKAFGIRDLVRARSAGFKSEISKLTNDQYREVPIRERLREHFGSESTNQLLKSTLESQELQDNLKTQGASRDPANEDDIEGQDFSTAGLLEAVDHSFVVPLNQGDLVEYWPDAGERKTAIILSKPSTNTGKRYIIVTERGQIDYANPNRFRFVLQEFYTQSKINTDELLQQDDAALIPFRKAIKKFKEASSAFSTQNARLLNNIYDHLPQSLKRTSSIVSSVDICRKLFGETTQAQLHATFEALMRSRKHFLPDSTLHMSVPLFSTRDPKEIETLERVSLWTRKSSPEFTNFIDRARKIAAFGMRITTELSGTLRAVDSKIKFTKDDTLFINFMVKACLERVDRPETELYTTIVSTIVKALQFFPDQKADRSMVYASLKKLGILAPWDSNLRRLEAAALPGQGTSRQADQYLKYEKSHFAHNQVEDLTQLGLADQSESIRHDFGQMPVYAIDGAGASELDDGISIDGKWLHIHIADPSSFIRYGSKLADIAAFRQATVYAVDRNYPMLPSPLTMKHFSLGCSSANPAMTTSMLIGDQGQVEEVRIRPSVVRNIKRTTYEEVDQSVFALTSRSHIISELSVNWDSSSRHESYTRSDLTPLSHQDILNIKDIHYLLQSVRKQRILEGMIDFYNTDHQTRIQPDKLPDVKLDYTEPTFYAGRPGIETASISQSLSYSRNLVQEAAILTNGTIARYAAERQIPLIYRIMQFQLNASERAKVHAFRDQQGRVRLEDMQDLIHKLGAAHMSLEPGPADLLGLPHGYTHATSPLRRYVDMIAQWQIQSYLLKRPYEVDLKSVLPLLIRRGKAMKRVDSAASRHWLLQLLHQKMERGEEMRFDATVRANNPRLHHPSDAIIKSLSQRCLIRRHPTDPEMVVGSIVTVSVEELDLMDNVIYARRIDLPETPKS